MFVLGWFSIGAVVVQNIMSVHSKSNHMPSSIAVSTMGERHRDMLVTTEAVLEDLVQNSSFFGDSSSTQNQARPIPAFDPKGRYYCVDMEPY